MDSLENQSPSPVKSQRSGNDKDSDGRFRIRKFAQNQQRKGKTYDDLPSDTETEETNNTKRIKSVLMGGSFCDSSCRLTCAVI